MKFATFLFTLTSLIVLESVSQAENWTQFRGPKSDGVASREKLPLEWDRQKNIRWKVELPGEGWSAPVIWGDRVFVTTAVMQTPPQGQRSGSQDDYDRSDLLSAVYNWEIHCLDAKTGKTIWKRVVKRGNPPLARHGSNTYATETPIVDGERVYAYFGMIGLFCYDLEGNKQWDRDLGSFKMRAGWGTASSPVLHGDKLFLQIDNEDQSFITALDAATGQETWRVNRPESSSYGSPVIWRNSHRTELIAGGQIYRSYNPNNGDLLWSLDMGKGRNSATPLPHEDFLYVGTEFRNRGGDDDGGGFLFAVKAGASGDITPAPGESSSSGVAWKCEKSGIQMASPAIANGHIYLFERRNSIVNCVNAETGDVVFRQRVPGARAFWSSPIVSGEQVYCTDSDGTTHVIQAGPQFEVLHANDIGESTWSTPAVANGAIFLRGKSTLFCIAHDS